MIPWNHISATLDPKYGHIIAPYVSSISTFIPELYRQCCADFIKCNVAHQK